MTKRKRRWGLFVKAQGRWELAEVFDELPDHIDISVRFSGLDWRVDEIESGKVKNPRTEAVRVLTKQIPDAK